LLGDLNDNVGVQGGSVKWLNRIFPLLEINMLNTSFFFGGYEVFEVGRREDIPIEIGE
jgi:hypothetical protein